MSRFNLEPQGHSGIVATELIYDFRLPIFDFPGLHSQFHELSRHFCVVYHQPPHTHRQLKSPWTCASRIEIQHTILILLLGYMSMAGNDGGKPRGLWFQVQLQEIVNEINRHAADFENCRGRKFLRPGSTIDISANRRNLRYCGQIFQDHWFIDVSASTNSIRSAEGHD